MYCTNQGSYIEFSNLARWKLFTLILKPWLFFTYSIGYYFDLSMLWSFSLLLIRFALALELKSCPEVMHIVSLKLTRVYLISTLCFWTMSFWMFLNFISIFSESVCLFFTWSFRSFYSLLRWAINDASWCFCKVYFLFFIL